MGDRLVSKLFCYSDEPATDKSPGGLVGLALATVGSH